MELKKDGTDTEINLKPYHDKDDFVLGGAVGYGFVPGTNDIYIRTKGQHGLHRMRSFTVSSDGVVALKETFWDLKGPPFRPGRRKLRPACPSTWART